MKTRGLPYEIRDLPEHQPLENPTRPKVENICTRKLKKKGKHAKRNR